MAKFKDLLTGKLFKKPDSIPAQVVKQADALSDIDKETLKRMGVLLGNLTDIMYQQTMVNQERGNLYREYERAVLYSLVGAAVEFYADTATPFDSMQNATVWPTSESGQYRTVIESLLDSIGIEEKICDWASNLAMYGDLFIKVKANPGVGIVAIDDSQHPINMSRVDVDGRLIGFFETPLGQTGDTTKLIPPWEQVHFRILGVHTRKPLYGTQMYTGYQAVTILAPDVRRVSSKYGLSLLSNSLPVYKRLRLAEDSLLLARLSKGILRYVYKVKVDGSNFEAVSSIIDQYSIVLKRARALNINPANPHFEDRLMDLCLRGNVKIPLLDGTSPSIKEMAEASSNYIGKEIWSVNPETKELEVDNIVDVKKTRLNAELVRVLLDSGEYVDCTPEHRFMLRDGSFVEAQGLKEGESLMPYGANKNEVVRVEKLEFREDTYDITTKKNHNFPVDAGIFVHNSAVEDVILPVWGNANDLTIEKIGGEADIRWIVDIEELRNQLAVALRIPLQLLGGYSRELPSALGQSALERLDIRFSRSMKRLQRALIDGIVRMCQIHLACLNMSPDVKLFDINMAATSNADEEELKNALDTGVKVVDALTDLIVKHAGDNIDKVELLNYLNNKILKLGDLDVKRLIKTAEVLPPEALAGLPEKKKNGRLFIKEGRNQDLFSYTIADEEKWNKNYKDCKVKVEVVS